MVLKYLESGSCCVHSRALAAFCRLIEPELFAKELPTTTDDALIVVTDATENHGQLKPSQPERKSRYLPTSLILAIPGFFLNFLGIRPVAFSVSQS